MAMNKELLTKAMSLIEDDSFLNTSVTYRRRGTRGDLHSEYCYYVEFDFTVSVLTVADAARSRVCRNCFSASTGNPALLAAALHLADRALRAQGLPHRPPDEEIPDLCNEVARLRLGLEEENLSETFPALERGAAKLAQLLDSTLKKYQARLPKVQSYALHRAATDVLGWDTSPRHQVQLPQHSAEIVTRLGESAVSASYAAVEMYRSWRMTRSDPKKSKGKARKEVLDTWAREGALTSLTQLEGVRLASNGSSLALDALTRAWSQQASVDIEVLLRLWEGLFSTNMKDTDPVVVGLNMRMVQYNREATHRAAFLKAFPQAAGSLTVVAECPAVVAKWVQRASPDFCSIVESSASQDILDTTAVLWDPSSSGAYVSLDSALSAARQLDRD